MKKSKGKVRKKDNEVSRRGNKAGVEKDLEDKAPNAKVPADFVEVRQNIAVLVRESAGEIATKVIEMAKGGQLAPAKYLFEAVGLYPPTEETESKPEDSLAYTLLMRLGLPTDPVICEEDAADSFTAAVKATTRDAGGIDKNDSGVEGQRDQRRDWEKSGSAPGEVKDGEDAVE